MLAPDDSTKTKIDALAKTFAQTGETGDLARLEQYAAALGLNTAAPALTTDELRASKLIPVKLKAAPAGFGGGGGAAPQTDPAEASRQQYNAMEMRGFADAKRTVFDIRNALSAEYGPQDIAKVLAFFEAAVKTGEFELKPVN